MMSINDIDQSVGSHLREEYEERLKKVDLKINVRRIELWFMRGGDEDAQTAWNLLKEGMNNRTTEIWNSLDFQSHVD